MSNVAISIDALSADVADAEGVNLFSVDVPGYEGPLHLLLELARRQRSGRLVLVETTQFVWQRARSREGRYLFAAADPMLVGLNTLQHWLWQRIGLPLVAKSAANA